MKKIEEYLYNNGLDWTDIILYILMGVLIALAIVLIGVIVYRIWHMGNSNCKTRIHFRRNLLHKGA